MQILDDILSKNVNSVNKKNNIRYIIIKLLLIKMLFFVILNILKLS